MSRFIILVSVVLCSLSFQVQARNSDYMSSSLGCSADRFGWNSAGDQNGENPNVAKEFSVDSLQAATFFLNIRETNGIGVVGVYEGSFSRYLGGAGIESQYASDNRGGEDYRRESDARGQGFSNAIGFGTEMRFAEQRFSVTPLLGYVLNRQRYDLTDGKQTIATAPEVLGAIDNFESRYEARWKGGWVGVDMAYTWASQFSLSGKFRYYDLRYSAEADWDKQTELQQPTSFTHTGTGAGTAVMLEMGYQYARNMAFILNVQFSDWSADSGEAVDYLTGGTQVNSQLNDVSWESNTVLFGVRSRF